MIQVIDFRKMMLDEESCWQAVQNRDSTFDGSFIYAVHSTGVYCRLGCPSRRPRRDQVAFFNSGIEARAAGFRPCLRCHPDEPLPSSAQAELIRRACALIDAAVEAPPSLDALAHEFHLSPSHFHRLFKSATGLTPRQYAAGQRLQKFKSGVKAGQDVITALYDAGFSSSSRLYEKAASSLGMTPAAYRRGGEAMQITYTIVSTRLGRMLVAATQRGICAVSFDDREERLETSLRAEFPTASLSRDDATLKTWIDALVAHLEGQQPHLSLPLDLQATAFQLRVWETLRQIPYGETRTYAQVASIIGSAKAVRAVGSACAHNPVAVITPCHRVVRTDGGLGGYRWGLERKQALLEQERLHSEK
jgi:AraC family transcriptional regulator, regulatory protein of adaptative response / methylated-DNA-[protein]-cysteine methyltransferase